MANWKKELKHFNEMDALLKQLSEDNGVVNFDKWHPTIEKHLKSKNVKGLIEAVNAEHKSESGGICTFRGGMQAILGLGAIANDEAIQALHDIDEGKIMAGSDQKRLAGHLYDVLIG